MLTGAIVFVSHFRIRPGGLPGLRALTGEMTSLIQREKPGTVAYLLFTDAEAGSCSVVHVFPDADAFDRHVEGAEDRSTAADAFMEPAGWEIYGRPHAAISEALRAGAAAAGVPLRLEPEPLGGFLRLGAA